MLLPQIRLRVVFNNTVLEHAADKQYNGRMGWSFDVPAFDYTLERYLLQFTKNLFLMVESVTFFVCLTKPTIIHLLF